MINSWTSNYYYFEMGRSLTQTVFYILDFVDWFWHLGVITNLKFWIRVGPKELIPPLEEQPRFGDDSKDFYELWRESREAKDDEATF